MNQFRDVAALVANWRATLPTGQGWTAELCTQILAAAMAELGAVAGAAYRLAEGQAELLGAYPTDASLPAQDALAGLMPDEGRLFSRALFPDEGLGALAALAWPCTANDQAALLFVFAPAHAPDPDRLRSLGALLGLAAENARLRHGRDREVRQSELLLRVSQAFMATMDLGALPHLIVSLVAEMMEQANNCVLHLTDSDHNLLVAISVSSTQATPPDPDAPPLRRGVGAAGLALATGQVVNIGDVSKDERYLPRPSSHHISSLLAAPLMVRAEPIGTLSVSSDIPFAFGEEDERLLMTVASLAAAAIDSADLVENLQKSLNELRQTQAQLIQAEKLSALGQLVAGITHEINNPLAAISGYAQLLAMNQELDPQTRQDVTRIHEQAQRAARIVRNLLTFAREHKAMQRPTDVNVLLQQSLELLAYPLRIEGISVDLRLARQALRVVGDPYQLQQVFVNLISNARDAMIAAQGGGRLTIVTELDGVTVRIRVRDTGPGLTPAAKRHMFEPFFTTKDVGKGTGLGLSICFGIVTEHAGTIYLNESYGPGAEFVVELPYTVLEPDSDDTPGPSELPHLSNRLVLVVEDEEPVARVLQRVLAQDGHRVMVTQDGGEALTYLRRAQERGAPFDLIISDIKMPNMGGDVLYEHILREHPELAERVLYVTGDSASPDTRAFLEQRGLPYVVKPFDLDELREAISDKLS